MAMIGTPTQAMVREAFSNRTLAGLGLLDGFESGCGCGSLPCSGMGMGVVETPGTGSGEGQYQPSINPCDDTSLWAVKKGADGRCWNYCLADLTQQVELDAATCAVGGATLTGKVTPKTMDMNMMLIAGIALGAFILTRQ